MNTAKHFRELAVYQGAMSLVMRIFELTRHFPIEERYTLTDQVRRSSRSVCANLAEAWRKRRYQAAFVSKLNDAETEAAETQVHAEIAFRHGYLNQEIFNEVDDACDKILAQIVKMIDQADRWVIKPREAPIPQQEPDSPLRKYADTPTRRHADTSLLIALSARNPVLVVVLTILGIFAGVYALSQTPLDAVPDLSDVQVIVYTDWQ